MEAHSSRHACVAALCLVVLLAHAATVEARPGYGQSCISCHGSGGFGNTVFGSMLSINGTSTAEIPNGAFGDPDRGEGPLPTYTTTPGNTFDLSITLSDPTNHDPSFFPLRFAVGIKNISNTDPDYQAGNPDTLTWRDNQLLLVGAQEFGVDFPDDPAPLPMNESQWTLYTDYTFVFEEQYYASTGDGGHEWNGPVTLLLTVTVPAGVLPGWYDIEVSTAGWDYGNPGGPFAFYDEAHFYLNVIPEPATYLLAASSIILLLRRRRHRTG